MKKHLTACLLGLSLFAPVPAEPEITHLYSWQPEDANHPQAVDVAIVLAVDVSSSVKKNERTFQREAYAAALSDPAVQEMALGGRSGRVALAYLEWSGSKSQRLHLPMEIMNSSEDLTWFAERISSIEDQPGDVLYVGSTAIGDALIAAEHAMRDLKVPARDFVIDISGDGIVNSGSDVTKVRDHLVAMGLTVNGLPIRVSNDSWGNAGNKPERVARFYEQCVIGGAGSFHLVADGFSAVRETLIMKLMLEMAQMDGAERRRLAGHWNTRGDQPLEQVIPAIVLQIPGNENTAPKKAKCTHYQRDAASPFEYP
ncbi:MAG: DUF1194 domain-containing protein [Pseudomonadota bacterium]